MDTDKKGLDADYASETRSKFLTKLVHFNHGEY